MSYRKQTNEVINLCSDDEGDDTAASSLISSVLKHQGKEKRADKETINNKRRRVSSAKPVIFLMPDDKVETTDLSQLLLQHALTMNDSAIICNSAAHPLQLYHIRQQDHWSCGFRNLQMTLIGILSILPDDHEYFYDRPKLDGELVKIPTLLNVQHLMEQAWLDGWDRNGAKHYQGMLAHKKVWIGAVEVASAMGCLHIDATVVQFIQCSASRSLLGPFCYNYFRKRAGCNICLSRSSRQCAVETLRTTESRDDHSIGVACSCSCSVLPLYLQWEGHSVTIVGVELNREMLVSHFIVLDPMKCGQSFTKSLQQGHFNPLRKPVGSLLQRNSQLIVCSTKVMTNAERELMKQTKNCITAAERAVELSHRTSKKGRVVDS
ncbi:hypothetical protein MPSEU_000716700 [Mayamaea pseudoterrestris]|nr:hypothetical protein MPSEU_000716700 [Mayamaea pseudoterrestris]